MSPVIRHLDAAGVHSRFDFSIAFHPNINVIYGRNGSGKTTVLHILANILNGAIERFAFLAFESVCVHLNDGTKIRIIRSQASEHSIFRIFRNDELLGSFTDDEANAYVRSGATGETEATSNIKAIKGQLIRQHISYFPAFRAMIEAWISSDPDDTYGRLPSRGDPSASAYAAERYRRAQRLARRSTTTLARDLFGQFVPEVRYPSPVEIEDELTAEVNAATYRMAQQTKTIHEDTFIKVFQAVFDEESLASRSIESTLDRINQLVNSLAEPAPIRESTRDRGREVIDSLRRTLSSPRAGALSQTAARVLSVYQWSLEEQVEYRSTAFEPIERYLKSVNDFLEGKSLVIRQTTSPARRSAVLVRFPDNKTGRLRTLSSGERQIISMLYAARKNRERSVVLIDEPELSLHIDWQRRLLREMVRQLGSAQIIVCTHSPEIGADYLDMYQEVEPVVRAEYDQIDIEHMVDPLSDEDAV